MFSLLEKVIGKIGITAFRSDKSKHANLHNNVGHDDNSANKMMAGGDINVFNNPVLVIDRVRKKLNTDKPSFAEAIEKISEDWKENAPKSIFLEREPQENDHPSLKELADYHKRFAECVDTILDHLKSDRRGDAMICIYRYMVDCLVRRVECKNKFSGDVTQVVVQYEENRLERETVWRAMDSMKSAYSHADEGVEFIMFVVYAICLSEGVMGPPKYENQGS